MLFSHKYVIGKADTWKTERKNLNFRTHIKRLHRKTICFSKNEDIYDNVIGMYSTPTLVFPGIIIARTFQARSSD
ncbi:IS1 family transposase [Desulfonema ishimotonii]|uniref:IS1 family transposase n=1 Tax=Desulfonema ishimotonii TaxID=45657 RepID=UPI000F565A2D